MSELQEVEIVIDKEGNIEAKVTGVKGQKCLDVTKELMQLLGGQVDNRELTDEYRQEEETQDEWQSQNSW